MPVSTFGPPEDRATIVWDRHDLIYGYGSIDDFAQTLSRLGFRPGKPEVPGPHEHHYHRVCDEQARALLASRHWSYTPLSPEDEQ